VARHKVRLVDEIGGFDRFFTKTQVGDGDTARFFRVIGEIALRIHIGMVTDNFDGVFVRADRTVGAQTPEFAGVGALRSGIRILFHLQRQFGHIVFDADGELFLRARSFHVAIHRHDLTGSGILGTQTVTTGVHRHALVFGAFQRRANIQEQRFAHGARLLGAIQHRDGFHRLGQRRDQVFRRERTIQADLDQTHFVAGGVHVVHRLLDGLTYRTHRDDDAFRVAGTIVVEQFVVGTDLFVDLVHVIFHDVRDRVVVAVRRLARLEEDIRVLSGTALHRMLRIQRVFAETIHRIPIHHVFQIVVIPHFDLLDLVRGTETIKEVDEGHAAFQRGQVRHSAEIHDFLHAGRT